MGGRGDKWVYHRGMVSTALFSSLAFALFGPEPEPNHLGTCWDVLRADPDWAETMEELYWLLQTINEWLADVATWLLDFVLPEALATAIGHVIGFLLSADLGHGIIAAAYALPLIYLGWDAKEAEPRNRR